MAASLYSAALKMLIGDQGKYWAIMLGITFATNKRPPAPVVN